MIYRGVRVTFAITGSDLEVIWKEAEKVHSVVTSKRRRHKISAIFLATAHATALQKCSESLDWAIKDFDVGLSLDAWFSTQTDRARQVTSRLSEAVHLFEVREKVQAVLTNQFLESLPRAKYAGYDCERPDRPTNCLEGTRVALLDTLTEWLTDLRAEVARLFWLKGIAGVGKTTVARTIAEVARIEGLLGGHFFFNRRGEAELRNPALFFPTIAYQLARFDSEFCQRITASLEADPEAPYATLRQQLDRLIIKPLSGIQRDPERIVMLVFDAFDECEARGAKEILQLLVAAIPALPFLLKILITSRPEPHIHSALDSPTSVHVATLHDIESSIVKNDIL